MGSPGGDSVVIVALVDVAVVAVVAVDVVVIVVVVVSVDGWASEANAHQAMRVFFLIFERERPRNGKKIKIKTLPILSVGSFGDVTATRNRRRFYFRAPENDREFIASNNIKYRPKFL